MKLSKEERAVRIVDQLFKLISQSKNDCGIRAFQTPFSKWNFISFHWGKRGTNNYNAMYTETPTKLGGFYTRLEQILGLENAKPYVRRIRNNRLVNSSAEDQASRPEHADPSLVSRTSE